MAKNLIADGLQISRRLMLASGAALMAAACRPKAKAPSEGKEQPTVAKPGDTIASAVAGKWRLPQDRARDVWRHPVETLQFFGLKPGQTVVEFWPGAGWYTDILAPFLNATHGKLYAANLQVSPDDPATTQIVDAYRRRLDSDKGLYGDVTTTAFGPTSGPVAPDGSADLVLFLRNLHNWMAAGIAEKAMHDAFQALKPGGVLGLVEHRATPGGIQDAAAPSGYVQEAYARKLAEEAGFKFDKASEINANPKDDHDHPFGVWTLPPTLLSAPRGEPPNPAFDHSPYVAIGESDRMTLRFIKPV